MTKLRITSVQFDVVYGDQKATLAKALRYVESAASEGADIIVFPELSLAAGYFLGTRFNDIAETIPGKTSAMLSRAAQDAGTCIIAGMAERGGQDVLYNSVVVATGDGRVGAYRKTHVFPMYENIFGVGDDLPLFDVGGGVKVGILVCYDLEFPEPARVLALKGADLIISPSAILKRPLDELSTVEASCFIPSLYATRALENRTPVVLSNRVGFDVDLKTDYGGLSRIVDNEGRTIVEASPDKEEAITAVVDLDEARLRRQAYNYFRDRKPYLYSAILSGQDDRQHL